MQIFTNEDETIIHNEMYRIICNIDYSKEELYFVLEKINITRDDYFFYKNLNPLINMNIENGKKQTLRNEAYRRVNKLKYKLDYMLEEHISKIKEKSND